MKLTYYGHACFLVETGGSKLLFDPAISPFPHGKKIDIDSIEADYILLSHGHGDHVADVEAIANRTGATVVGAFEVMEWYKGKGLEKVHHMNLGGKWKFDFGWVKMVAAVHSSMLPDGSYGSNPGGYVIWNEDKCFYFAGDTALTMDMKLIPMTCPRLDLAILPIGDDLTMGSEDAIIAADFIECENIVGCHFDTFPYIKIDHEATKGRFDKAGLNFKLPDIGETWEV